MGNGQPYMYDAPVRYSDDTPFKPFDPKAASRASWAPPSPPKAKQEGPLLAGYNRHPDSWHETPIVRTEEAPMNPHTKSRVKWTRIGQLGLRIVQIIGAAGLLVCAILLKSEADNENWSIRLPPAASILITTYAIYHLSRPARSRPPASTASYHFFAICMDTGLVCFFVFISLLSRHQWLELDPYDPTGWHVYFGDGVDYHATEIVKPVAFVTSSVLALLHAISFLLDLWLVTTFRQIARLPPDMNPLEDNLTSRRITKHKYKNSSISNASSERSNEKWRGVDDKNMTSDKATSRVSFFHSRAGLDTTYSAHNPSTVEFHRQALAEPYMPKGRLSPMPANPSISKRDSYQQISPSVDDEMASKRSSVETKVNIEADNWFVVNEKELAESYEGQRDPKERHEDMRAAAADGDDYDPYRQASDDGRWKNPLKTTTSTVYSAIPLFSTEEDTHLTAPQPLRMNPPTPPQPTLQSTPSPRKHARLLSGSHLSPPKTHSSLAHTTTTTSDRTPTMTTETSQYSDDETDLSGPTSTFSTAPKGKFYGDVSSARHNLRHHHDQGTTSPRPMSMVGSVHYTGSDLSTNTNSNNNASSSPRKQGLRPKSMVDSVNGTVVRPETGSSPRVVSRTGVDYMGKDSDLGLSSTFGRRDVSGKVAEEGRGGRWGSGMFQRKVSGLA